MKRLLLAALATLAACDVSSSHWCFGMEYGDCGSPSAPYIIPPDTVRIVGFPERHVIAYRTSASYTEYRGALAVGDTLTLYLVSLPRGDTVRSVVWTTDPSSPSLRVETGARGAGKLTAISVGNAYVVQANGQSVPLWWCRGEGTCEKLSYIAVSR
jgi:uncharacterized protein YjdB